MITGGGPETGTTDPTPAYKVGVYEDYLDDERS